MGVFPAQTLKIVKILIFQSRHSYLHPVFKTKQNKTRQDIAAKATDLSNEKASCKSLFRNPADARLSLCPISGENQFRTIVLQRFQQETNS